MKVLFTVHAGEYLAGSEIERRFPRHRLWIPSRDTGIDLLVTDERCRKTASIQVKFSKDYTPTHVEELLRHNVAAASWFKFSRSSLQKSPAEIWILVIYPFKKLKPYFIICRPREMLSMIQQHHGVRKEYDLYFWVTRDSACWETRDLTVAQLRNVSLGRTVGLERSRRFTRSLNRWSILERKLRV